MLSYLSSILTVHGIRILKNTSISVHPTASLVWMDESIPTFEDAYIRECQVVQCQPTGMCKFPFFLHGTGNFVLENGNIDTRSISIKRVKNITNSIKTVCKISAQVRLTFLIGWRSATNFELRFKGNDTHAAASGICII